MFTFCSGGGFIFLKYLFTPGVLRICMELYFCSILLKAKAADLVLAHLARGGASSSDTYIAHP